MRLADVAVPVPLARAFTYEVPERLLGVSAGARVLCPFGRRQVLGVVLRAFDGEAPDGVRIKPIVDLVDPEPVLPAELLAFLRELGDYYFAPVGEVLRLALPAVEREHAERLARRDLEAPAALGRMVGGRRIQVARPTERLEEPGKLRGQAAAILALLRAQGETFVSRLEERFPNARPSVKKLEKLGLVSLELREAPRDPFFAPLEGGRDAPPELNDAQALATAKIEASLDLATPSPEGGANRAFLLFGVTGSGKTEVYLHAIAACLARGKGAVMMVPEIALTPQLAARFRARFGDDVAILHSGLAERDRHAMWKRLRRGELKVAIGARSALFAPVEDLGLIVVDEEHDGSFKQEEGVRYHARDMALLRAHRAGAACVLGSATPSLESVALARRGKLEMLRLPDRAVREAQLPRVEIVDLRRNGPGPADEALLSLPLHRALEKTLAAKEQAILFLNRRGFAPSVVCASCGEVETCLACSVALTFHRGRGPNAGRVRCHYCDFAAPLPEACSGCRAPALFLEGLGTEKLEGVIAGAFPEARVARLDRDVTRGSGAEAILERMRAGEIDVLVGTQMVTKGHDLPNVTLVGVINADAALSLPDFRAGERGFQLLVQVAGRAGRRDKPGRVLIQTRAPDHPAVVCAARHNVEGFLERELSDRQEVGYPPFSRLALVRIDAPTEELAQDAARMLAAAVRTGKGAMAGRVEVLGPAPAPIARLRGRFRYRVMLRAEERAHLRAALALASSAREKGDHRVRVVLDVDPVSML